MRAVILAAGSGERLRPLTDDIPKCLVSIDGKTILERQYTALCRAGIRDVAVVTGAHGEKVEAFARGREGLSTITNPDYASTNVLYSFGRALTRLEDDADVLVMAGDVVFDAFLPETLAREDGADLRLCVSRKVCGAEEVKVFVDNDRVIRLGKKLKPTGAYGEFLGVFRIRARAMRRVRNLTEKTLAAGGRRAYLFDMINALIDRGDSDIRAVEIGRTLWEEIDYPEDVERATLKIRRLSEKGTGVRTP